MNWIDAIVIAALVAAAIWGIYKGFVAQLVSILGIFVGIWGSSKLTPFISNWVADIFGAHESIATIRIIVFIVLVMVIIILCHFAGRLIEKVMKLTILGGLNKLLGAIFCTLKVLLILIAVSSLVENGLKTMNVEEPQALKTSKSYQYCNEAADNMLPFIKELYEKHHNGKQENEG